ncbi:MAG: hypothetical protein QOJ74_453, partial [Ilumatobacteraceae bacterium]|nr:hypothetical protein [Ilumatobacteraceae bacterium]
MDIANISTGRRRRRGWRAAGAATLVTVVLGVSAAPAH